MTVALHILTTLVLSLLAYWMGWRTGRKLLLKATVDYVLAQQAPRRNWEERMLDYARLESSRPDQWRVKW